MHTVVSADGTTIAYDRAGAGPPLVMVGGAFNTRQTVAGWVEPLTERFTVYSYDRRGRGDSGDTPPYAVAREVEDLAALIEAAGGRAAVFGHSSGGALALEAAAAGVAVTRVAVYEPPYAVGARHGGAEGAEVAEDREPQFAGELAKLATSSPPGAAATHFLTVAGTPPEVVAQMRESPGWAGMQAIEHTLAYDAKVVGDTGVPTARLAGITVPVLVLAGGAGWDWVRASGAVVARSVPDGRYRELEGQSHGVSPEALYPALVDFFGG